MRQVLIDHARGKRRVKRGGGASRDQGDVAELAGEPAAQSEGADFDEVLALDAAMERMRALDPQAAEVVKLRFFGGLSVEEIASALGVSERTVKRDWQFARAWLAKELSSFSPPSPPAS
jgi:RNA polymerase sigma factor (TIGR02999 family)